MARDASAQALILVVDDIPDTVQLLTDWLHSQNFRAIGTTKAADALELAARQKPALILLDLMMPTLNGIEMCRRLQANPETAHIPVILVTAKNAADARAEGMMAGAVGFMTKPLNLEELTKRIESTLHAGQETPLDVQPLLEEVAHSSLAILSCNAVWLLERDAVAQVLRSRVLVTNSALKVEMDFLAAASSGQQTPEFPLKDEANPLCAALLTRSTVRNVPTAYLKEAASAQALAQALDLLRVSYLTLVPLALGARTLGVMLLGSSQPLNLESARAQQTLSSLASQAAIVLDYSRLISDLSRRERDMHSEQAYREMILDTMSDALVVIDAAGLMRYVNRRLMRLTNFTKENLEGRSVAELFHREDRDGVMKGLLKEDSATMKFDQRLVTQEGRVIPVLLSRTRVRDGSNRGNQVLILSDMTEQKSREAAFQRQTSRLMALNRAAQLMTTNPSLNETLQNILKAALDVAQAQGASLFLLNESRDELVVVAAVGEQADVLLGVRVPIGEGVAGWVAREAKSQLVGNMSTDPRFYKGVDEKTGMSTKSLIAVPLITAEQVIGVIEVVNKLEGEFDEDDVRMMESMAGTAAVSIVNARLFGETQRRVMELATLLNVSAAATSTLEFPSVLEHVARSLVNGLGVARCMIMSWNHEQRRLESLAELADACWLSNGPQRPLKDTLAGRSLASGHPTIVSLADPDLTPADRAELEAQGVAQAMIVPLHLEGRLAGLATLLSMDAQLRYNADDAAQVSLLAQSWHQALPVGAHPLATPDEDDLRNLAKRIASIPRTCWVSLDSWNEGDDFTRLVCAWGFAEWTQRKGVALSVENLPTLRNVIESKQVRVVTMDTLTDDSAERDWLQQRGGASCMMLPLIEHGGAIGIVKLVDLDQRTFDSQQVSLAQGIANIASYAMENARLYLSLQSRARALELAYAELQEADRAKDQFIQNVSHELRTPIMHVLNYAELLSDGDLGATSNEQREALRVIKEKSQRLAELVGEIVSVQALESQRFEGQRVDLLALLRQLMGQYVQRAQQSGLRIVTRLPKELPPVLADPQTLSEALDKLMDNAMKFGSQGERIEVSVQDTTGPVVQVSVRDYGIGIDSSQHEKIFQRFYQVDGSATRRYPGTGLGLALAKMIVEKHGGQIGVNSKLDEGATFYFTLLKYEPTPAVEAPQAARP